MKNCSSAWPTRSSSFRKSLDGWSLPLGSLLTAARLRAHAIKINRAGGKAYLAVVGHHAVVSTDSQVLMQVLAALIDAPSPARARRLARL